MFPYLYTALLIVAFGLLWPVVLAMSLLPKYRRSIRARFFFYKNPPFKDIDIHFHSCSLGETKALAPLVERFERKGISVITQTGYEAAKAYKGAQVRYLPYEPWLWWWLQPVKALVVMEAELWYLLFFLAKKQGAATFLINARISDKSYPKYRRFAWFYKRVFANIDHVYAQSEEDKKRLKALGAKNVEVSGNIKLLVRPVVTKHYTKTRPLIVAASTHDPEEEIIATDWVMRQMGKSTLVVVPRHPERFEEVDELLRHIAKREGLRYHRLSQKEELDADIVLVDRMGELVNLYAVADLVILGGSFVKGIGGHNPIEAAYFGVPIISGPYYHNQEQTYGYVEGIEVVEANDLQEALQGAWQPTRVTGKVAIEPIIERIEDVVRNG